MIKPFSDISKDDISLVGGKAASLGEMTRAGFLVPQGFVITTKALADFTEEQFPKELKQEILRSFKTLAIDRVAVRSSAVAEDSGSSSFAGQFETFLNTTEHNLIENVLKCVKSAKSLAVEDYASAQGIDKKELNIAVVVQKMIDSEVSGVMFTVNPVTKNKEELMIEAIYGLGEMIVQGMVTPDNFVVDKKTLEIKSRVVSDQNRMLTFQDGDNKELPVPEDKQGKPSLSDEEIKSLAEIGLRIEEHYNYPQDIEWGLEKGNLYILQSRPITTL